MTERPRPRAPKVHLLPMGPEEERSLLQELLRGDPRAFEMLYQRFVGRVLGLSRQILGDPTVAEDAAQETFMRVFRGIHKYRGDARLGTWVHRVTVNVCLRELDRRKRRRPSPGVPLPAPGPEPDPAAAASHRIGAARLEAILAELPPLKRVAYYLYSVEGMSASEIAEVQGESRAAVLKRLQRTRREVLGRWNALYGESEDRGGGASGPAGHEEGKR